MRGKRGNVPTNMDANVSKFTIFGNYLQLRKMGFLVEGQLRRVHRAVAILSLKYMAPHMTMNFPRGIWH